jgi:hypothetical protein
MEGRPVTSGNRLKGMIARWTGSTALLLITVAQAFWTPVWAQTSAPEADPPEPAAVEPKPVVDVSRLPINIERIRRQLRETTVREERNGLNLRYTIDVYGQAPRIELFTPRDNLLTGPVPFTAPTHQDMLNIMTPKEFSAPAANFGNLFNWLADKAKDKSKK